MNSEVSAVRQNNSYQLLIDNPNEEISSSTISKTNDVIKNTFTVSEGQEGIWFTKEQIRLITGELLSALTTVNQETTQIVKETVQNLKEMKQSNITRVRWVAFYCLSFGICAGTLIGAFAKKCE